VAAKTRLEFCKLNDYRCKAHYNCALCEDLWIAATDAMVEKFTSTNNARDEICPISSIGCAQGKVVTICSRGDIFCPHVGQTSPVA